MFDHSIYLDLSNEHMFDFSYLAINLPFYVIQGHQFFPQFCQKKRCVQQTKIDQKWGFQPKLWDFQLRVTVVDLEILSQHFGQFVIHKTNCKLEPKIQFYLHVSLVFCLLYPSLASQLKAQQDLIFGSAEEWLLGKCVWLIFVIHPFKNTVPVRTTFKCKSFKDP